MKNKLTDLSLEELIKKRKITKLLTGITLGLVIVMAITGIVDYYRHETFKVSQILALFFIPMLLSNFLSIKKLTNEIKTREDLV